MPAVPLTPCETLINECRTWMAKAWGRKTARVVVGYADESEVLLADKITSPYGIAGQNMELSGKAIDHALFAAARAYGMRHREEYPAHVLITAIDGAFAKLTIPPHMPADADLEPDAPSFDGAEEPPSSPEWRFGETWVELDGKRFRITGKPRRLLELLVDAFEAGEPVETKAIIADLWAASDAMTAKNAHTLVSNLRTKLQAELGDRVEIVNRDDLGYVLRFKSASEQPSR